MELDDVKNLLKALEGTNVTELEWQVGEARLRVCRGAVRVSSLEPAGAAGAAAPASAPQANPAANEVPQTPASDSGLQVVSSPIVGTFYRSPDPNSPAFVNVGDHVHVGQVLCIIEAMKLMNEIEAELAGEIVKIHPESGQPVQYGDVLFTIKPQK